MLQTIENRRRIAFTAHVSVRLADSGRWVAVTYLASGSIAQSGRSRQAAPEALIAIIPECYTIQVEN